MYAVKFHANVMTADIPSYIRARWDGDYAAIYPTPERLRLALSSLDIEFAFCRSISGSKWIAYSHPESGGVKHPLACGRHDCQITGAGLDGLLKAATLAYDSGDSRLHDVDITRFTKPAAIKLIAMAAIGGQPDVFEALIR